MESRTKTVEYNTTECEYTGPKKPPMPYNIALKQVPPLSLLANYTRMQSYANDTDSLWKSSLMKHPPSGMNTIPDKHARKVLDFVKRNDQELPIFTIDQQLYKVRIDIMFNQPSYFEKVVPITGPNAQCDGLHLGNLHAY